MRLRTALGAVSLALVLPAAASSDRPSALVERSGPAEVGKPFPSFAGWGLDGAMISSRRLLEKPRVGEAPRGLVVSFFATWCQPCRANLPALARSVAAAAGVRAVLVHYGPEEPESLAAFLRDAKLALPVVLDPHLKISSRCGVTQSLPRTFVLDGAGNVAAIFEFEGPDFEQALSAVLAKLQQPSLVMPVAAGGQPAR
jgi:peroxiredoxin